MASTELSSQQYVVFKLGKEEYGFDISAVKEIHEVLHIAKVHRAPSYIEGVMNLRGKLVTVVDLRSRFSLGPKAVDEASKIVVVDAPDNPVGFLVDEVSEVLRFTSEEIEETPPILTKDIEAEYVLGIAKRDNRLITLIDPLKVLELSCDATDLPGGGKAGHSTRSG
jgi:purine-binding chemotaxis protein CheW